MRERDIFIEALERGNPSERTALLDDACKADADLRGRVERLLAEHDRQESFILDTPLVALDATLELPHSERVGTVIGPYKLLQQIGEGGMGVVFMAEQTKPLQRTVAIKII
ncbi:MAG: serine/threonine protein kinase, partial [Pirellulales bacterium]